MRFLCSTYGGGITAVRMNEDSFVVTAEISGNEPAEVTITVGPDGTRASKVTAADGQVAAASPDTRSLEQVLASRLAEAGVRRSSRRELRRGRRDARAAVSGGEGPWASTSILAQRARDVHGGAGNRVGGQLGRAHRRHPTGAFGEDGARLVDHHFGDRLVVERGVSFGRMSTQAEDRRVFLSYNQADVAVARSVGAHLALAGVEVWFDEWKIRTVIDIKSST